MNKSNGARTTLSITNSPSLFIRMLDGDFDIHLEFFYEDRGKCECFLTIYEGDGLKINNYGTISEMIEIIRQL